MLRARLRQPGQLELVEEEIPRAQAGEIILKIEGNTLCGTDYRIYTGQKTSGVKAGVTPGHEMAGRIHEIGAGVEGYEVGRQATVSIVVSCGRCQPCLNDLEHLCQNLNLFGYFYDGGLSEYVRVPAEAVARGNVIQTGEELPVEALCLAEPISCCLHGLDQFQVHPGDNVLVLGAGPIGLIHTQLALMSGARQVIVSNRGQARRELAEKLGAKAVDPTSENLVEYVHEHTAGRGADVVIVCIGDSELAHTALQAAALRGRVSYFAGFPAGSKAHTEVNLIHYKELSVTGGSNAPRRDVKRAIELLQGGKFAVDQLVTHRFGLDQVHQAYDALHEKVGVKILVSPPGIN